MIHCFKASFYQQSPRQDWFPVLIYYNICHIIPLQVSNTICYICNFEVLNRIKHFILVITCNPLVPPKNAVVICSAGSNYAAVCTIVCTFGYEISGPSRRSCQEDGSWSNQQPSCVCKFGSILNGAWVCLCSCDYLEIVRIT